MRAVSDALDIPAKSAHVTERRIGDFALLTPGGLFYTPGAALVHESCV
jgi:hypothetical protein